MNNKKKKDRLQYSLITLVTESKNSKYLVGHLHFTPTFHHDLEWGEWLYRVALKV
jgi:hypothetical protein